MSISIIWRGIFETVSCCFPELLFLVFRVALAPNFKFEARNFFELLQFFFHFFIFQSSFFFKIWFARLRVNLQTLSGQTHWHNWHYLTLQYTKRRYRTNHFARQLSLLYPCILPLFERNTSRRSNQSQHSEMKPILVVFNVCTFIALIQGAFTDIPSPIEGAEADLTIPAALSLRGK